MISQQTNKQCSSTLLEEYTQFLRMVKQYSPHTVLAYKKDILDLFHEVTIPLQQISRQHIRQHLQHLQQQRNLNSNSLARHISSLRQWFGFLKDINVISKNPMSIFHSHKKILKLPHFLSQKKNQIAVGSIVHFHLHFHFFFNKPHPHKCYPLQRTIFANESSDHRRNVVRTWITNL